MGDFVNLVSDCGDGFDEQQVEQAILESLANSGAPPPKAKKKPSLYGDDDLEAALAASMRTFEAEQGGAAGPTAGRKRSSSDDGDDPQQQQQQPHQQHQQGHVHHSLMQAHAAQQQPAGGALKRQRSISSAGNGALGFTELAGQNPQQQQQQLTPTQPRGRLGRLLGGVVVTTGLHQQQPHQHPQQQQQLLGILGSHQQGVQRSSSVTNVGTGLRPWPSRGLMPQHQQQQQQQQGQYGMGRSASAHDLQGLGQEDALSEELAGSRPSSPAAAGHHGHDNIDLLQEPDADDEDDFGDYGDLEEGQVSDSSISSIEHESGLPHTISTWGPALLQAAPAAPAAPRLIGPGPVPGDATDWCIHDRQFYEGQPIFWQQWRQSFSLPGKILTVEGGGGDGPLLYTAEVYSRFDGLKYVEATAAQLHPQLRLGDFVWCKPAAVKSNQWSGKGPLYSQLHPLGPSNIRPESPQAAQWKLGCVQQLQLFEGRNPIAELRIIGTGGVDCCWFKYNQLELMREVGESSAAAEKRARAAGAAAAGAGAGSPAAAGEQQQGAAAAAAAAEEVVTEELDLVPEQQEQGDEGLLELANAGEQQGGSQLQDTPAATPAAAVAAAEPPGPGGLQAAASPGAAAAAAPAPAEGGTLETSPDPAAAPSLLSHPDAAVTGESELEAPATAGGAVEQPAGSLQHPQPQQQQHASAAMSAQPLSPGLTSDKAGSQQKQPPQQQQHQVGVLQQEGTGESAEGVVQEVVGDSCGGLGGDADVSRDTGSGSGEAHKEPAKSTEPWAEVGQEGFGET